MMTTSNSCEKDQKIPGEDCQDADFIAELLSSSPDRESLLTRCLSDLTSDGGPRPMTRQFVTNPTKQLSEGSAASDLSGTEETQFRLLSWNILAQALGAEPGTFTEIPEGTVDWKCRRLRLLYKILFYDPDIICLQEVDHFNFLNGTLSSLGYIGLFQPKPNSPCLKMTNNNGPDGCALFVHRRKFELVDASFRILENSAGVPSNQVCLVANLKVPENDQTFCITTTHLKARAGLEVLRNEQGKDLAQYLISCKNGGSTKPLIVCGDFNAVPTESVVATIKEKLALSSAYSKLYDGAEPPYTRWKIRDHKEFKDTIDYILHNKFCEIESLLPLPLEDEIGSNLPPNLVYPSDHLALVVDFRLKNSI